jgi:hypothetical protein
MDLITVRQPLTSAPTCPALGPPDMMPNPEQLRAYYKNVQVRGSSAAQHAVNLVSLQLKCVVGCTYYL